MKGIRTKYHGPGNVRGARISAYDGDGNRVVISYPYELSGEACHRAAADALCKKMNWPGPLVGGGLKDGWVFCFAEASPEVMAMRDALSNVSEMYAFLRDRHQEPERCASLIVARKALQPFTR